MQLPAFYNERLSERIVATVTTSLIECAAARSTTDCNANYIIRSFCNATSHPLHWLLLLHSEQPSLAPIATFTWTFHCWRQGARCNSSRISKPCPERATLTSFHGLRITFLYIIVSSRMRVCSLLSTSLLGLKNTFLRMILAATPMLQLSFRAVLFASCLHPKCLQREAQSSKVHSSFPQRESYSSRVFCKIHIGFSRHWIGIANIKRNIKK